MKKLGIIGGFGPKTTSEFMLALVFMWKKHLPSTRPEMLIWNGPVNENLEEAFIKRGKHSTEFKDLAITGAKTLEKAGAEFLVIPCNSLHIFIDSIRESVNIPILSIPEITVAHLKQTGVKRVAILGTQATIKSGLLADFLKEAGINVVTPSSKDQSKLNKIILNLVTGKAVSKSVFKKIVNNIKTKNPEKIILACTDLQLIQPHDEKSGFIDTLRLLEETTIEKML